jgi:hypothetical protein
MIKMNRFSTGGKSYFLSFPIERTGSGIGWFLLEQSEPATRLLEPEARHHGSIGFGARAGNGILARASVLDLPAVRELDQTWAFRIVASHNRTGNDVLP